MGSYLIPYARINMKSNNLKTRVTPETIRMLEEKVGEKSYNMGVGRGFLDMTPPPKVHAVKATTS